MAAVALLLSVVLLCTHRIDTAIWLCALQALCAAIALGETTTAVLSFALNGVALPWAVARMSHAMTFPPRSNSTPFLVLSAALLVVTIIVFVMDGAGETAAVGGSVALGGLLLAGLRAPAGLPALGLLSSQNGLVLVASIHRSLLLPATLAVTVPLIPSLVLAKMWLHR